MFNCITCLGAFLDCLFHVTYYARVDCMAFEAPFDNIPKVDDGGFSMNKRLSILVQRLEENAQCFLLLHVELAVVCRFKTVVSNNIFQKIELTENSMCAVFPDGKLLIIFELSNLMCVGRLHFLMEKAIFRPISVNFCNAGKKK